MGPDQTLQVIFDMKKAAIAANGIQPVLILAIFYIKGFELGAVVIFFLFLLMTVPFINFLLFLFYKNTPVDPEPSETEPHPLVKRKALRILYHPDRRPVLNIKNQTHDIIDLSEGGLRIVLKNDQHLNKKVKGNIQLLAGNAINIKGVVQRNENNEAAIIFPKKLDIGLILAEKKCIDTPS